MKSRVSRFSSAKRLEPRREMPQKRRLIKKLQTANGLALLPDFENDFHYVVHVALRINAPGNCQPHQVHLRGFAEHQRADLDRANSPFKVEFCRQSDGRET